MKIVNIAASSLALGAFATLGAQAPRATLERAAAVYAAATTLSASFDQTVSNPLTGHTLDSHGELLRKRPNLLSISFSSPATDRIVSDGSALWVYLPSSAPGQVMKLPIAAENAMLIDPLGQILSAPSDSYTIVGAGAATVGGRATHAVAITPVSNRASFTHATIWVDDANGIVRQIEAAEQSGLVRKVTLNSFRPNVSIPRSAFVFDPPPGVRIVDPARGGVQ